MTNNRPPARKYPRWSVFSLRDGERIERAVRDGKAPCCPRCGEALRAQAESRFFSPRVSLDATAHDLVCEDCRRIWCVVRHSARSLRLVRMRRLAAAVEAAHGDSTSGPGRASVRRAASPDGGTFIHFHAV